MNVHVPVRVVAGAWRWTVARLAMRVLPVELWPPVVRWALGGLELEVDGEWATLEVECEVVRR